LLGGEAAVEHPDDGRPVQAAADDEGDERLEVSAAPREDADGDEPTGDVDELAGIKIEDVDKNATERKTRRRRRQPKE
jgi:hypothetical protein